MFASVCHPVPLPAFLASVHVLGRTCARLFLSEQSSAGAKKVKAETNADRVSSARMV